MGAEHRRDLSALRTLPLLLAGVGGMYWFWWRHPDAPPVTLDLAPPPEK